MIVGVVQLEGWQSFVGVAALALMLLVATELFVRITCPIKQMRDFYPNGECPDCGEPIPKGIINGEECTNCGHVFCEPSPCNDECEHCQ